MLNRKEKKNAINRMNAKNEELKEKGDKVVTKASILFEKRQELKKNIDELWILINEFRNKPADLLLKLDKVQIEYSRYASLVNDIEVSSERANIKAGTAAGGGIVAGVGVAALGPTAAMGIATTFGTASTGAAISGLSGAAASNAALAWLGGGTLAAGGGGMAAGDVLLALSGPIGWSIAGAGILAGGALANGKNKKVTKKANEATQQLIDQILILDGSLEEINRLDERTVQATQNSAKFSAEISDYNRNYDSLNETQQYRLGAILNDILSYAKLLNKSVGKK